MPLAVANPPAKRVLSQQSIALSSQPLPAVATISPAVTAREQQARDHAQAKAALADWDSLAPLSSSQQNAISELSAIVSQRIALPPVHDPLFVVRAALLCSLLSLVFKIE